MRFLVENRFEQYHHGLLISVPAFGKDLAQEAVAHRKKFRAWPLG